MSVKYVQSIEYFENIDLNEMLRELKYPGLLSEPECMAMFQNTISGCNVIMSSNGGYEAVKNTNWYKYTSKLIARLLLDLHCHGTSLQKMSMENPTETLTHISILVDTIRLQISQLDTQQDFNKFMDDLLTA